ncbi:YdeI/OmpD-associated family protein [Limimaricola pyoseonensis]|uniref:Uncharacterized conserved protein YdeI, YjbR/CyaY-like superfamily, DUF1801 family n=1 Tax=Limimaricola pyoseonensis TaxID=521013 RepID=A0A1G7CTV9_9RHOB|nr:YdeI/OmpD-associated family protein [Limimaricola pyoseonensis]SDE42661.1 Uncharacterized conserved protein YdeI, YjbR/CyaY-like superfamily, DUF1801 family [Limimaricola pyoseonensis]
MAKRPLEDAEEVELTSRAALRDWLAANHARDRGVWLVSYKKAAGDRYLPMGEIVRECLCWGWVDSLSRGKDDLRSMVWIAPRKPGSNWSKINKDHVAALEAEESMQPPGRAVIDRAKADGTWTALDEVEAGVVPRDLEAALTARPGTRAVWDGYPRSVTRAALEQLLNARTPATREKRIRAIVEAAEAGERPFQWRKG